MRNRKLFVLILAIALLAGFAGVAFADELVVKLVIPELCASNFMEATAVFDGFGSVDSYEVDVESTSAVLTFLNGDADLESIKEALRGVSMPVKSTEVVK